MPSEPSCPCLVRLQTVSFTRTNVMCVVCVNVACVNQFLLHDSHPYTVFALQATLEIIKFITESKKFDEFNGKNAKRKDKVEEEIRKVPNTNHHQDVRC